MPSIPRRWFAFRLRTLFVVMAVLSIPLAWWAYYIDWVRQRRAFEARTYTAGSLSAPFVCRNGTPAPWGLSFFEEGGATLVDCLSKDTDLARRLFPEALIIDEGPERDTASDTP